MPTLSRQRFIELAARAAAAEGRASRAATLGAPPSPLGRGLVIPVCVSLLDDQLTPVVAYRRLVAPDERTEPSFLFESVEGGERQGRHSLLGARPAMEVVARGRDVRVQVHNRTGAGDGSSTTTLTTADPLDVPRRLSEGLRLVSDDVLEVPKCFLGGWVGYAAYDTVRYAEPDRLDSARAPRDDRGLPELHFAFYDGVVAFDHVRKLVHIVGLARVENGADASQAGAAYDRAAAAIEARIVQLQTHTEPLSTGRFGGKTVGGVAGAWASNLTREQHARMVARAKEYIAAGDIFQVVLGQRFERRSQADPFDVYRALRAVNPSPYMVYLQAAGSILVASSPEILCRVRSEGGGGADGSSGKGRKLVVTNRPLAGTRRRGATPDEDAALERELLADPKERAEHIMLVDLGRNDVGRIAVPGTIKTPALMTVERYSHVMHISSTVTGELREGLDAWDALRAALPAGTISGAPKIRAMQIIDELEPVRRGPYGGGMGYVGLDGQMDIALALRTMVVPISMRREVGGVGGKGAEWVYHVQASGGIVADSETEAEYQETVSKAAALARAIDVAEAAFGSPLPGGPGAADGPAGGRGA